MAHAAFAAGEENLRGLVPDLVRVLASPPAPDTRDGWLVVNHVLDALIRLDAKAPMEALALYEDDIRNSVLILAIRNGEAAYPLLRKTLERSIRWQKVAAAGVAAGNVLVAAKDRGVARLFTGHIEPLLNLTVLDHDCFGIGGWRDFGAGHGDRWCEVPEDFPPYVWYELVFKKTEGHWPRLLATGPVKDVWIARWSNPGKRFILGSLSSEGEATKVCLGWAASLLDVGVEDLPLRRSYYGRHVWSDPGAYLAFVERERCDAQEDAETLLTHLVLAGFLGAEDRTAITIRPRIQISDHRENKGVPLPAVEGVVAR